MLLIDIKTTLTPSGKLLVEYTQLNHKTGIAKQHKPRRRICDYVVAIDEVIVLDTAVVNAATGLDCSLSTTRVRLGEVRDVLNILFGIEGVDNNPYMKENADGTLTMLKSLKDVLTGEVLSLLIGAHRKRKEEDRVAKQNKAHKLGFDIYTRSKHKKKVVNKTKAMH